MGYFLKSSSTAKPLLFLMVDSTDHVTGKTGLTCTVTLSKNGAAFASPAGAVTELANGWYKVAGNATDTGTVGPLTLHATASGADPTDDVFTVVAFDPDAAYTTSSSLPTNFGVMSIDSSGRIDLGKWLGNAVSLDANNVPNVSTKYLNGTLQTARDIGASVLLSNGTGTGQIKLNSGSLSLFGTQAFNNTGSWTGNIVGNVTGNVEGSVSADLVTILGVDANGLSAFNQFGTDQTTGTVTVGGYASGQGPTAQLAGSFSTVNTTLGTISTNVSGVKAKTDNLPASPAAVGSTMTLAAVDGVTFQSWCEVMLALAESGKTTSVDNGNGTITTTFYKQNGTTAKYSVTFNKTTGVRTASAILA